MYIKVFTGIEKCSQIFMAEREPGWAGGLAVMADISNWGRGRSFPLMSKLNLNVKDVIR